MRPAGRGCRSLSVLAALFIGSLGSSGVITEASDSTPALEASPASHLRATRLAATYESWKRARHPRADGYRLVVGLSWFPGISLERSQATGFASIDMESGAVAVELEGVDSDRLGDVWLIDNREGGSSGAMPDPTDAAVRVGSLEIGNGFGTFSAGLDPRLFDDFDVDQVVITRRGEEAVAGGVLYGSPSLFERLYRIGWRVERELPPVAGAAPGTGPYAGFPPRPVSTERSPAALRTLSELLTEGDEIFFEETFDGNGRTCGTCHPAENNFTLDAGFIERLPPNDPLFVAEFNDDLNQELNGGLYFENPVLMREFGLIVVNADGFEDLAEKYVLRSPNHLFAMALTIEPAATNCHPVPPNHRLGWGGDGAPGAGTLREFAIGAVIQHNPQTLGRIEGEDFRLPTDFELDALEAFQLELGRRQELQLGTIVFLDPDVSAGRDLFNGDNARCSVCHEGGGAQRRVPGGGKNFNFDIGLNNVLHPARGLGEPMPFDDGFASDPVARHCANTFSTPSIIEAADTAPFGHNNVFATLEEAVGHYSTPAFNEHSSAGRSITGDIDLTDEEIDQIGALLRVLNALQNIDEVHNCVDRVRVIESLGRSRHVLRACIADAQDALDVLSESPLDSLHPTARADLGAAVDLLRQAQQASTIEARDASMELAEQELAEARADMIEDPGF